MGNDMCVEKDDHKYSDFSGYSDMDKEFTNIARNQKARFEPLFVAAIDFGTTFSGYAFMSKTDFASGTTKVEDKEWQIGKWTRNKTPTSVLFDENQQLHSFGYTAEYFYSDNICNANLDMDKWYFFRNIKNELTEKQDDLDDQYMLFDIRNKNRMKAVDVLTKIIRYLKDDLLKTLNQRLMNFDEGVVKWILTVPVLWHTNTVGFFKRAAIQAGIPTDRQTIILEPEAAAFYCEQKDFEIIKSEDGAKSLSQLPLKTKYLVVDLGGGTIDITEHMRENQKTNSFHQNALGLKWGGTTVNKCFEEYCSSKFEQDFIKFKENHPDDYLYFMENFEHEKIQFTVDKLNKSESIRVRIPVSLSSNGKDKLLIPSKIFRSFFNTSIDSLVRKLKQLLLSAENEMQTVKTIFVVGGFAESSIVVCELKSEFSQFDIVVPKKPELAVMHGAVLSGFK